MQRLNDRDTHGVGPEERDDLSQGGQFSEHRGVPSIHQEREKHEIISISISISNSVDP